MARPLAPLAIPLLAFSLSGCVLFHSNVKGGFACAAPRGTCAPSTTIDDAAIKEIEAQKNAPDGNAPSPRTASHDTTADAAVPNRAALRVVYPAWHDGSGHVHKRTVAYVNVDAAGEVPVGIVIAAGDRKSGTNLLAIAENAPELAQVSQVSALPTPHDQRPAPSTAPASVPTPIGAIQTQVRDILAKAPKPTISAPGTNAGPAAPPAVGGTLSPQQGE